MSYDLAVWKGDKPSSDEKALATHLALYDKWFADQKDETLDRTPDPVIVAYVGELLERWPDIDTDEGEDSPWADGPLLVDAAGPYIYFPMVFGMCEEASQFAAEVAARHGLVCFDPQTESLRP